MFKGVFMSKEINHWCVVCGKGYHACDSCNETKSFTPWRTLTDSIEHFKIFTVLKDFNNKLISKKEARELLSNVDLSDKDSFKDSAKSVLAEIYKDDVVETKTTRKRNKVVAEIEVTENNTEE
jgi:hypothetical protein